MKLICLSYQNYGILYTPHWNYDIVYMPQLSPSLINSACNRLLTDRKYALMIATRCVKPLREYGACAGLPLRADSEVPYAVFIRGTMDETFLWSVNVSHLSQCVFYELWCPWSVNVSYLS